MCAIRGRYGGGEQTRQILEVGEADFSHTLTSVQKDNYVIELTDSPDWEDMEKRK
jgi:hypothetical protein